MHHGPVKRFPELVQETSSGMVRDETCTASPSFVGINSASRADDPAGVRSSSTDARPTSA